MRQTALPIDALLPQIKAVLQQGSNLLLEAAPGAGKTTRVPPLVLECVRGEVIVLEPRRIAARLAARRVAWEMGEDLGETVGYQVRFEKVSGPKTRLHFVTEGILTRRLLADPLLKGVDAVVLDEFHERHMDGDLALALLKRLQIERPGLKIVVMSATLDSAPVARYLSHCPVLQSEGRAFPLTLRHLPYSPEPLHVQMRLAVETLLREGHAGHVLAFLPGLAEIRRALRECEGLARANDLLLLPLHGDLAPTEQDRALAPSPQRKVIFATNVAESSVTVEGVTAVIDSGLARVAAHSPWTGLPTLEVARISKASARQRAGRAGRTAAGTVVRLYPEEDFVQRPDYDTPEILRSDLAQVGLALRAAGIGSFRAMEWLDAPPEAAVQHAEALLDRLGASDVVMAQKLARFPLPVRVARMLVESMERGVGESGCRAAALLSAGVRNEANDLLTAMDLPLDRAVQQQLQQIVRIARPAKQTGSHDEALLLSLLTGFPDRVARLRAGRQIVLANGTSAELVDEPPAYEFLVVLDAEDRREKPLPQVRMTARIEAEWLLDLFPEQVREETSLAWNRATERVESVSRLLYGAIVLEESRDGKASNAEDVAEMLTDKAMEAGLGRFADEEVIDNLLQRIAFAGLEKPDVERTLRSLCLGLRSFAELKRAAVDLPAMLEAAVPAQRLRELAPGSIRLAGGRQTKVNYEAGKPPWIASRMQDFFGMHETPRVGASRTPLVVHLLGPNGRAVQTTTDLAGFWERLYPQVRRELMRRYPRHQWPEKP